MTDAPKKRGPGQPPHAPTSQQRKLGKTHQNVLVFVKGDGKRATQACGEVEVHIPEASETDE